jgi:adenylate kinase family enzyme
MNIEDTLKYIAQNQPKTIHISGKTSTGKSTLAKELRDLFKYEIVELDQIVISEIVKHNSSIEEGLIFAEVYKNRNRLDWIEQFVSSATERLNELHSAKINTIIEGAIGNPQTLREVLGDSSAIIIYLHPKNLQTYVRNLTSRFLTATHENNAGLPSKFWNKVPSDDFKFFLKDKKLSPPIKNAIEAYAKESQIESAKRLRTFQNHFDNIAVVNI